MYLSHFQLNMAALVLRTKFPKTCSKKEISPKPKMLPKLMGEPAFNHYELNVK